MSGNTSSNPNRFGPHSAGLTAFLDLVLELSDEQLSAVATRRMELEKDAARILSKRLDRAPLAARSAVDKASRATFQRLKGRLEEVGGGPALMSGDNAVWHAGRAIAFPGTVDEEQSDMAVAPFVAVGIDCRALSQMGLVE